MPDFKQRFGELDRASGEYVFSNVRNGLIVGLVRSPRNAHMSSYID